MKAIITIIIILLIGLAAWLVVRNPDEAGSADNAAAAAQALQRDADAQAEADAEIDLGEFQDKG